MEMEGETRLKMAYDLSNLTNMSGGETSYATFFCEASHVSNDWMAYIVVFLILIVALVAIIKKGYTLYTALPVSFFLGSLAATFMWAMKCTSGHTLPGWVAVTFWAATTLFVGLRIAVKES